MKKKPQKVELPKSNLALKAKAADNQSKQKKSPGRYSSIHFEDLL
jgi:hypothetical protein